jgi:hypothetical protein
MARRSKLQAAINKGRFDSYDIEQVFWIDSSGWDGWRPKEMGPAMMDESMLCRSVGYVIDEDELQLALVGSEAGETFNDRLHIPKVAIIHRQLLRKAEEALDAGYGQSRKL